MLRDVRIGLTATPKQLSPKYFYDERGSELFEQITLLPEYYLTRAERDLLQNRMPSIVNSVHPCSLVELGAGSASKTRVIIDAMRDSGCAECYVPIDVSRDFLEGTARQLRGEYPDLRVMPIASDITEPFELPPLVSPVLIAFLGSTIGNFSRDEAVGLLSHVARVMHPLDRFLLGADLVKDPAILTQAYNDSQHVTAAFNLNVLDRLNRELGASFPLDAFAHHAFYDSDLRRIEMHLVARRALAVEIPGVGKIRFDKGESIRTEVSYKYDRSSVDDILAASGLSIEQWMPAEDASFALVLARTRSTE
jgi:L-histidine N-alpha-methyltransferase